MKTVNILVEALPYIKKFHRKKIMIKYGGHAMIDEAAMDSTARDTVLLKYVGMEPVVVHGGGPEISRAMNKMGKEPKFIEGLRVTDEETMEIVKMVLVGKINTSIVSKICYHGGRAIGLSGKDSNLLLARKRAPHVVRDDETGERREIDLGLVGEIESVDPGIINMLTDNNYIPVISPIGVDRDANTLNLNADTVAGEVAAGIGAEKLIVLTDVPGILEDPSDPDTLIRRISVDELSDLVKSGIVEGGMLPKTLTCIQAINDGVSSAHIIDGRVEHSLLLEIFTKKGIGTMITE
ncbi:MULTISPECIES: acetylglutamate kinase [Methanothermobacter]|jgi:acetylglutamate kinase|uniref:Acetylglutamate kinase n=2 Tax=Methanothermobacter TaxID=145260 RepID=ARGB_METTH|nr:MULTISPECIES: acetylglutamate kinase [Methanothermobacter]O26285.1 RecName: Full=Acetylglutamate kinase; AltName: Full=N-acetyl-L-glutamate 5-phosphotransferase; AltName: Full=NAG kinase; Short=NAGK [Methanothermobacter thermautotrophicus str. Delta H]MBC7111447.1 acetylglutamate kinase [Methanothermobacter sp.]AAB84689.1 acetylglutamate kinase [Methanothermobacter thermautotrophicus str. Delta H]MDI6818423.1 acetylglutamate kinase [Methanothermobacter thermautotrophicus]MDK2874801.1 acetyl